MEGEVGRDESEGMRQGQVVQGLVGCEKDFNCGEGGSHRRF